MLSEISVIFGEWASIAGLVATIVIGYGGYLYITSAGSPDKLAYGKQLIYTAIIGVVVIIGAGVIGGVVTKWVAAPPVISKPDTFSQGDKQQFVCEGNLVQVSVCELIRQMVDSGMQVVDRGLTDVLARTNVLSQNPGVVVMWQQSFGLALGLLLIILAMYGYGIMGSEMFGMSDYTFSALIKRLILAVGSASVSLYLLDLPIRLANALTGEVLAGGGAGLLQSFFSSSSFDSLSGSLFFAILALVAVIFGVVLLVFYAVRHMVIVLVAVLAPILLVLAILPKFSKMLDTVLRMYVGLVAVVVVHAIMIRLAVALLTISNLPAFLNYFAALALMYILVKTPAIGIEMLSGHMGTAFANKAGKNLVNMSQWTGAKVQKWWTTRNVSAPAISEPKRPIHRRRKK